MDSKPSNSHLAKPDEAGSLIKLDDGREVKVGFTGLGGTHPITVPPVLRKPGICVSRVPAVARIDHIPEECYPPGYDVWVVNLFAHQRTVTTIKEKFPAAKVIVQVDTLPEALHTENATNLIGQVKAADLIGDVSEINARFYSGLTGKPYIVIPAPIGPMQWFEERQNQTRAAQFAKTGELELDDFILAADHFYVMNWCLPNLAALAAAQRKTGLKIKYINAGEFTKQYMTALGLKCEFLPEMSFENMLMTSMKAVIAIDMYAAHSQGRHAAALATLGLPVIGSIYTGAECPIKADPFDAETVAEQAAEALISKERYAALRAKGFDQIYSCRTDDAVAEKIQRAVKMVMNERSSEAMPYQYQYKETSARKLPSKSVRKNLVVVHAGSNSFHPDWIKEGSANFDIFVSYSGEVSDHFRDGVQFCEFAAGPKWPALAKLLFERHDLFMSYDAIWFPDDDVKASTGIINRMFDLFHSYKLWLAQPALGPGSNIVYSATAQVADLRLHYTGLVEILCPIFNRSALELLASTFAQSRSGWGLDFLWAHLLNYPLERIAVLDETPVTHTTTRSLQALYQQVKISPQFELENILNCYGIERPLDIPVHKRVPLSDPCIDETGLKAAPELFSLGPQSDHFIPDRLGHLISFQETGALGLIQREEALFLFGVIRMTRPKTIVQLGFGYGYSALNILKALGDDTMLYCYEPSEAWAMRAENGFTKCGNFCLIKKSPTDFAAADIEERFIDFLFMDATLDPATFRKIFESLLPSLSDDAIVALHNTGTWRRRHFLPIHNQIQRALPDGWLNPEEFQHRKAARESVNWVANNFPEFQLMHFHASDCIRHGITLLQRKRLLATEYQGVKANPKRLKLPGVSRAVCINLPRRQDRWFGFQSKVKEAGLEFVKKFNAIDGRDLNLPLELESHKGAYGCLHSHAAVYREALKNKARNILVLEDDCVFACEIETIADYLRATVGRFSWIHLGGTVYCMPRRTSRHPTHIEVASVLNTHAYVIDRTLMTSYLSWLEKDPFPKTILMHADQLLLHLCQQNSLKMCIPPKPLVWQDKSQSGDVEWGVPQQGEPN